jgi:hypothetical protein
MFLERSFKYIYLNTFEQCRSSEVLNNWYEKFLDNMLKQCFSERLVRGI